MNRLAITEAADYSQTVFLQINLTQASGDSSGADECSSTQAPDEETDAAPKETVKGQPGNVQKITLHRSFV